MGFRLGIVGLANAGKSTIFNALTAIGVPAEAYPFCTVDPNIGKVPVQDERLDKLAELLKPERVVQAVLDFVDIAGLVRGAHKGEGLGNQFLSHIRNVDAIAEVIRCFEDTKISHPEGSLDPVRDAEIIIMELIQKDLEGIDRRLEKARHMLRVGDKKTTIEVGLLERLKSQLEDLKPLRGLAFTEEETPIIKEMAPLTLKQVFYVANLGEESVDAKTHPFLEKLNAHAQQEGLKVVPFWGKLEAEIHELDKEEQDIFLKEMGLKVSGLSEVIRTGYQILDLVTFYTAVGPELRAWVLPRGTTALHAAGKIHTDFEKGFIKAEVASFDDFVRAGSETEARKSGTLRVEGREYIIQDRDVVHFRFKV
jgi:GTP-binding protein YchF